MKKLFFIIGVCVIAGSLYGCSNKSTADKKVEIPSKMELEEEDFVQEDLEYGKWISTIAYPNSIEISAEDLTEAYNANPANAISTYSDRIIHVLGYVSEIDADYFILHSKESNIQIKCYADIKDISSLRRLDTVKVHGYFDGGDGDYLIVNVDRISNFSRLK